jgi:fructose-1,6-bisphosphatase/inositol monophosphatase family enzyme
VQSQIDADAILAELTALQADLRAALATHMRAQAAATWSRTVRDDAGDTIFGIDVAVEELLLERCRRWGERQRFRLVAEGLDPAGVMFGEEGAGGPPFVLIADPIDGTRGLMFDKRSAFCLMAAAPERGPATSLADIELAAMTELPTTRQATSDVLWAVRGRGAHGERHDLRTGQRAAIPVVPTQAATLRHGFATVASFFRGGRELTARLDEAIVERALGPWNPEKAEVYSDQYICSGGQLAELALGRDRFVLDARPLVYRKLGVRSSLCCRPYDVCCALIAEEAGCIVADPFGAPLAAPLDTTTNVAWAGYANPKLAELLQPIVREEVERLLG